MTFGAPMVVYSQNPVKLYDQLQRLEAHAEQQAGDAHPPLQFHNFVNGAPTICIFAARRVRLFMSILRFVKCKNAWHTWAVRHAVPILLQRGRASAADRCLGKYAF